MPWWIWLILSLFMLAMIVAGIAYAALHGFRALNGIAEIGSRLRQAPLRARGRSAGCGRARAARPSDIHPTVEQRHQPV